MTYTDQEKTDIIAQYRQGKPIQELCAEYDMAVNALATASGIPPSTVYSMLNEKSQNPGVVSIKKICDGLGISIREFFDTDLFGNL